MSKLEEFHLALVMESCWLIPMFTEPFATISSGSAGSMSSAGMIGLWLLAFLIGGIPFGFIAGKLNGIDVRNQGSGNIGATNVFRVVGKGWGIFVFILDFIKAFLPLNLYRYYFAGIENLPVEVDLFLLVSGVLAVVGHNYSPYLGFKGGKGMATSAGFLAGLIPWSLNYPLCVPGFHCGWDSTSSGDLVFLSLPDLVTYRILVSRYHERLATSQQYQETESRNRAPLC